MGSRVDVCVTFNKLQNTSTKWNAILHSHVHNYVSLAVVPYHQQQCHHLVLSIFLSFSYSGRYHIMIFVYISLMIIDIERLVRWFFVTYLRL